MNTQGAWDRRLPPSGQVTLIFILIQFKNNLGKADPLYNDNDTKQSQGFSHAAINVLAILNLQKGSMRRVSGKAYLFLHYSQGNKIDQTASDRNTKGMRLQGKHKSNFSINTSLKSDAWQKGAGEANDSSMLSLIKYLHTFPQALCNALPAFCSVCKQS